jgi:hypothetical protein
VIAIVGKMRAQVDDTLQDEFIEDGGIIFVGVVVNIQRIGW